jgi:aminopeptidase N
VLELMFPRQIATQETLDTVNAWLTSTSANPAAQRYVREGCADLQRALTAQAKDAPA